MMRLADLKPKLLGTLEAGVVVFDCPSGAKHRLRIHVRRGPAGDGPRLDAEPAATVRYWQATGEFPESLTLSPSVNEQHVDPETGSVVHQCWHGHIRDGAVQ